MERWSEPKSMQPVYGDNASRNTVNLNLSECFFKLVDNSWRVNRGTRYREGSLHTKHQVTVKSFKKKMTAFCFYCSLFWCRRYWMKHLWPKRSKTAFPVERLWSDVELHWTLNRNAHSINLNIIWTSHDLSPLSLCRLIKNSTFSARPYSFVDSNGSSG